LIDEVFIVVFDVKLPLHVLHLGTLLEDLPLILKHFPPGNLTLAHKGNKLASFLQLFAESTQLLGTLCIPTAGFANLTNFTSAETYVWIAIIRFLARFELRKLVYS
jgi:hypothetical protein